MEEEVMYKHIDLYVNEFTKDLGKDGRTAIKVLYKKASAVGVLPEIDENPHPV